MLLSDRDLRAEIDAGRLGIEPFDAKLLQPSSIDVRLDRFFRVFVNTKYTHIDPSLQQDELTSLVEPQGDEPFVLHPGEFVLGSTFEQITLPDDLAGRLEGKSSLGRLGLLTHSRLASSIPVSVVTSLWSVECGEPADHAVARNEDRAAVPFRLSSPAEHPYGSAGVGSRYQGQRGPTPSRAYLNFQRVDTHR